MQDIVKTILKDGLYGKNTHINPQKALKDLRVDIARKCPNNGIRSCWDLLYHVVTWQEAILNAIKGKRVDWKEISQTKNWPSEEDLRDDSNFIKLSNKFIEGIKEAEELIETIDIQKPVLSWNNEPAIRAFLVLLQHNSYHFGHLVAIRKQLNNWPSDLNY